MNSKKQCKSCKKYFSIELKTWIISNYGNFHIRECLNDWTVNNIEFIKSKEAKNRVKKKAVERKRKNKELRIMKNNDRNHQLSLTQDSYNKLIRLRELKWFHDRGLEPYCISCQKELGGDIWCCGHMISRGHSEYLRYDPKNTYLQHNKRCNQALSGDIEGYKKGLKIRFGEKEGQEIIDYCEANKDKNYAYSCEELIKMRKAFNKEIRELEKEMDCD
jgi:hypothetical protein